MNEIITIEDTSSLNIKGATKVVSSTSSQAVVETKDNSIIISGSGLEVRALDLENGQVSFCGKVSVIKFAPLGNQKTPFLKRLFK